MIEVLDVFKAEGETTFLAVQLMDLFLNMHTDERIKKDLHLIACTTIYIASKMEDVYPINLNNVVYKIIQNPKKTYILM